MPDGRLPDSIEAAIYYLVAEAVTNVAKYAQADRVEALGGHLRIESPPGRGTRLFAEIPCD